MLYGHKVHLFILCLVLKQYHHKKLLYPPRTLVWHDVLSHDTLEIVSNTIHLAISLDLFRYLEKVSHIPTKLYSWLKLHHCCVKILLIPSEAASAVFMAAAVHFRSVDESGCFVRAIPTKTITKHLNYMIDQVHCFKYTYNE